MCVSVRDHQPGKPGVEDAVSLGWIIADSVIWLLEGTGDPTQLPGRP